MNCTLFWGAGRTQNHPKHKLALTAIQNTRNNWQVENLDIQNKGVKSDENATKSVKRFPAIRKTNPTRFADRIWRGIIERL